MKLLFILLITAFTIFANPLWFYKLEHKNYEIIGYGIDKELQVARDMAKSEVAKTIKVSITSSMNINKSSSTTSYKNEISSNLTSSSNATLQGLVIVKESYHDNSWYVAVKYDNRTLLQKIKEKYPNYKSAHNFNSLNVIRKNSYWYLKVKQHSFLLSDDNLVSLFYYHDNNNFEFSGNKKVYSSYDEMLFSLKSNYSKNKFVSILYVEQNGKVGVISANKKLDKTLRIPAKNEDKLQAYNPTKKTITEMYVALVTKKRLDLREFETISDTVLDESNYNFHKLLAIMKSSENRNNYATLKVKIRGSNVNSH